MKDHLFVGFGFGPIQSALFASEAFKSGQFKRIVIAEVDQKLVDAVRANKGGYVVNVATSYSVEVQRIESIEILNPTVEEDRNQLITELKQATEIVTSLPSVDYYDMGEHSVASLIGQALKGSEANGVLVYTAENNNHAAEILEEKVNTKPSIPVQYLNTVIGKMSQVVIDSEAIKEKNLQPLVPGIDRAFLVEAFNKILVTQCHINGFRPGIEVFIEKEDLLPFEEAKLYGHNAIHALMGFLGSVNDYTTMDQLGQDQAIMQIARQAFLEDSGPALIKKHGHLGDELFTESGYRHYAEDLLDRIVNPYLSDSVERAMRDPIRKLSLHDRIFGTMILALEQGLEPHHMAIGAVAGIKILLQKPDAYNIPEKYRCEHGKELNRDIIKNLLQWLWDEKDNPYQDQLIKYVQDYMELS
jgi:mannitol-1-phosphate 5-dehydrogenase